jgi:hypothetical protein
MLLVKTNNQLLEIIAVFVFKSKANLQDAIFSELVRNSPNVIRIFSIGDVESVKVRNGRGDGSETSVSGDDARTRPKTQMARAIGKTRKESAF